MNDDWAEVLRWRKDERQRLIEARMAASAESRQAGSERIAAALDRTIGDVGNRIVSTYWPFRGEPDLRGWAERLIERGGRIALPVVIQKGAPLEFRLWKPGDPLERGVWNILVPSTGGPVMPDVVIAPVVGADASNYRLGYGGGFFDRTLRAVTPYPMTVGVSFTLGFLPLLRPSRLDIELDAMLTEDGVMWQRD